MKVTIKDFARSNSSTDTTDHMVARLTNNTTYDQSHTIPAFSTSVIFTLVPPGNFQFTLIAQNVNNINDPTPININPIIVTDPTILPPGDPTWDGTFIVEPD